MSSRRARELMDVVTLFAATAGAVDMRTGRRERVPYRLRPRETIDDVLRRARENRPAFDLRLDGRVAEPPAGEKG